MILTFNFGRFETPKSMCDEMNCLYLNFYTSATGIVVSPLSTNVLWQCEFSLWVIRILFGFNAT